jgi:hypothetical protein
MTIRDYRCSIHLSPASTQDIITIKVTQTTMDGTIRNNVQYSHAVKKDKGFAPVIARRCSTMRDPSVIRPEIKGIDK